MSTLRLVAVGGLKDGRYEAGIDITMAPGSHTYWKMPGEAGVPPVFTFDGSDNVRQAEVSYPAPRRITEEGLDAFGYTGQVVFPVAVTPTDASKPSTLHVDVTYAVCNRICMPGHNEATLQLKPHGDGVAPELVEAALARVPRQAAGATDLRISRERNVTQPTWTLTWTGKTPLDDIFSDAPEGFYFSTKKTAPGTWTLTADQGVVAPNADRVPVSLVLASSVSATEMKQTFDIGPVGK